MDAGGDSVEEMLGARGVRVPLPCRHPQKERRTHVHRDAHLFEIAFECLNKKERGGKGGLFHQRGKRKNKSMEA